MAYRAQRRVATSRDGGDDAEESDSVDDDDEPEQLFAAADGGDDEDDEETVTFHVCAERRPEISERVRVRLQLLRGTADEDRGGVLRRGRFLTVSPKLTFVHFEHSTIK